MPVYPQSIATPPPATIYFAGHSFLNTTVGVPDQRFRIDSLVRHRYNIQAGNTTNRALAGALLVREWTAGAPTSFAGFPTIIQQVSRPTLGSGPYAGNAGMAVYLWGINDLGNVPTTGGAAGMTQVIAALKHTLRACISRHRASALYEGAWTGSGGQLLISYAANFTSAGSTQNFSSGSDIRGCSNTSTSNTVTITLPTDYTGEAVAVGFIGQTSGGTWGAAQTAGFGGTATFTGTALSTGHAGGASAQNNATFSTSNVMPTGTTHVPLCFRITDLDTTAAGKTIIITCTAVDSGGGATLYFDYVQLEATDAPGVVVCNISYSTSGSTTIGYGGYTSTWTGGASYWNTQGTPGSTGDADVDAANVAIAAVVAEFDSRVAVADIKKALATSGGVADTTLLNPTDNIHPNMRGARKCADAIAAAINQLRGANDSSVTETAYPGGGALRIGHAKSTFPGAQQWYEPMNGVTAYSTYTGVAGDIFAYPFYITEETENWDMFQVEVSTASATTPATIRLGVYDDEDMNGYPRVLISEPLGTTFSVGTTTGAKQTTAFNIAPDFGMYWLAFKVETIGTATAVYQAYSNGAAGFMLPRSVATGNPSQPTAWKATGLGAGALPASFPLNATAVNLSPKIWIRRL
jgi:hypothetical protein